MMYFVYAVVAVVTFVILAINLSPFKKSAVQYPSTDSTLMILLCIFFIADIGRDIVSREMHLYYSTMTALAILSAAIPVI
jgi:metal-dependent HD superfamily phosphatase/phosphodiesterase